MRKNVMFLSMFAMVISFVVWSMVSPVAPQLTKLYHLSIFDKSVLVATPILLGSLLRIPLGILTDRFGGRRVYTLLLLYLVIPLLGVSTAHSFVSLVFWEVLLGVAGTSFAVGIGHVSAWYPPEKQGLVLGITALGNIGTAVAGFSIPALFLHFGFSFTARILIIPVVIMASLVWFFTRDPVADAEGELVRKSAAGTSERFWTNPNLWLLSVFYFITFGGFVAFGNYLPSLLQSQFSLQPVDAGMRASGFVVLSTAIRPIGGFLADRMRATRLLTAVFGVIALCAVLFALGIQNLAASTVAALLISMMLGLGNGSVFKLVPLHFPGATGKAAGIVGAAGGIGGFFPPLVMGAVKQWTGSYAVGILLLAVACAVAFALSFSKDIHLRNTARGSL